MRVKGKGSGFKGWTRVSVNLVMPGVRPGFKRVKRLGIVQIWGSFGDLCNHGAVTEAPRPQSNHINLALSQNSERRVPPFSGTTHMGSKACQQKLTLTAGQHAPNLRASSFSSQIGFRAALSWHLVSSSLIKTWGKPYDPT